MSKYTPIIYVVVSFLMILVAFTACGDRERLKRNIIGMKQTPIVLPLEKMLSWQYGLERDTIAASQYRLVIYTDSTKCSSCFIRSLAIWHDFIDLEKDGKVELIFIMEVSKDELEYYGNIMKLSHLNHTVYFDVGNVFRKCNPHIPEEDLYHVFLLDRSNNVVMVGNPATNAKAKDLFIEILRGDHKL